MRSVHDPGFSMHAAALCLKSERSLTLAETTHIAYSASAHPCFIAYIIHWSCLYELLSMTVMF